MFLTVSIPHLKLPRFLRRDGGLDVTAHAKQRIPKILNNVYEEKIACQCERTCCKFTATGSFSDILGVLTQEHMDQKSLNFV